MPEKWTGDLVGRMHCEHVTYKDLGAEMGVGKSYISMLLNGRKKPPNIQARMEAALDSLLEKRKSAGA